MSRKPGGRWKLFLFLPLPFGGARLIRRFYRAHAGLLPGPDFPVDLTPRAQMNRRIDGVALRRGKMTAPLKPLCFGGLKKNEKRCFGSQIPNGGEGGGSSAAPGGWFLLFLLRKNEQKPKESRLLFVFSPPVLFYSSH